jgi:asparagine synthase (glutamine-hydrolysing)
MLSRLARFGGDAPQLETEGSAAFGASLVKLLPVDEFDRQPIREGGRWLFVADVRLDNREELEAALPARRGPAADSDLLFDALTSWGEAALKRIVGDFAFALFDAQSRTLMLGRDPTGQRPLYYSTGRDFVAFASMPNAIAGTAGISPKLNYRSLARVMSDVPVAADESYFAEVQKVLPGHVVTFSPGHDRASDYWRPLDARPGSHESADWEECYRALLDQSVAPRLRRTTGPIAAQLSSGLDSGAVCAAVVRLAGRGSLRAFTSAPAAPVDAVVPGRFADESELAARVAARLGIAHFVVRDKGSAIAHLKRHAAIYQEPFRNNINAGWISSIAAAARAEGCRVMLTGDVGNLTLNAGSLAVLGDFLRAGKLGLWLREARFACTRGGARWTGVLMNSFGHRLPQWAVDNLQRRVLGHERRTDATFVRQEAADRFVAPALPLPHERRSGDSYADRLAILRSMDFGNHNKGILAETGIDLRHPLLDRRAIEFSLTVPAEELLRDGRSRSLARRALKPRLPDEILWMHDRGYQAGDWHERVGRDELFAMIDEIKASHCAQQLIDTARLQRMAEQWETIDFNDPSQNLAVTTYLSLSLAGGLFIAEAERGFPSMNEGSRASVKAAAPGSTQHDRGSGPPARP